MSKKRYLVTGGTGFIGFAIVQKLLSEGHFVKVLDNNSRGNYLKFSELNDNIEFIKGDIRDLEVVKESHKNIDSVIHLAFINGTKYFYSKPEEVIEVGLKGMMNVIDSCIFHNVSELILASSSEVYQTPKNIPTDEKVELKIPDVHNPRYSYGGSKIISELIALNYGKKFFERVIIFRPHNVYGPEMGFEHVIPEFIKKIYDISMNKNLDQELIIQGTGQETRSFIYIDDFVDAFNFILLKGKNLNIYNIGTMDEISILSLLKNLLKLMNVTTSVKKSPLQKGGTLRRCPDINKVLDLGYIQKNSINQGLQKTIDWYLKYFEKNNL